MSDNIFNIKTTYKIKESYETNEILLLSEFDKTFINERMVELPTKIAKENNVTSLKYLRGNSNLNFVSDNHHIKIKVNNATKDNYEQVVINNIPKYKENYKFYDNAYIKKLYDGKPKSELEESDLINLAKELRILHTSETNGIDAFYKELPGKKVLCHGDLRPKNIIFSEEVNLIDFEWARVNSFYWDLASVIINFKLNPTEAELFLKEYGNINYSDLEIAASEVDKANEEFDDNNYFKIA